MEEIENFEELEKPQIEKPIKEKKKKNGKVINIISNIFFIPVMAILIVYLIYAINIQKENGIPSFFGQSYVRVMSGSMRKSGFNKGDVVVLKKVKISEIKAADENEKNGSVIAFYHSSLKANNTTSKLSLSKEKLITTKDFKTGKETFQTAIYFHQVIGVYYDQAGNTWFETKGTSNSAPDSTLVRGDYVVGQYVDSGMAGVIEFISSPKGMIVLIIVPSSVLLLLLLLNIIEIVDQMMREKKEGSAKFGDIKERELEVTTIIEENSEDTTTITKKRRGRKKKEENVAVEISDNKKIVKKYY